MTDKIIIGLFALCVIILGISFLDSPPGAPTPECLTEESIKLLHVKE